MRNGAAGGPGPCPAPCRSAGLCCAPRGPMADGWGACPPPVSPNYVLAGRGRATLSLSGRGPSLRQPTCAPAPAPSPGASASFPRVPMLVYGVRTGGFDMTSRSRPPRVVGTGPAASSRHLDTLRPASRVRRRTIPPRTACVHFARSMVWGTTSSSRCCSTCWVSTSEQGAHLAGRAEQRRIAGSSSSGRRGAS